MFVPVWGHLTNTMNVDIVSLFFFFLPKVLSFSFILLLRCRVIGDVIGDGPMTGLPRLSFLDPEAEKYTAPISWTNFEHCESHHRNKTSVDYLNNWGGGGEGTAEI